MLTLIIAFFFSVVSLSSQNVVIRDINDMIPADNSIRIGKLDNGLTYYIKVNKKPENRAELLLATKVGAVLEDDDQDGLAHFTEHMAFNGTKNFPKNALVNYLETIGVKFGADLNAFTSHDQTVYMLQLPTDNQEQFLKGVEVLRDWAGNVSFDPEEIDKERGVILEEWRLGKGAEDRVDKKHQQVLFYKSRYAERDVIGDTSVILNAPYENFTRFYKDWYRPNLMAVIAVGDFDMDQMEQLIKEKFGSLTNPTKERERTKYELTYHKETLVSVETDKELSMPMIQMFFKMPGMVRGTYNEYRQNILDGLYTSMLDARLQEISRKGDAPFVMSFTGASDFLGKSRIFMMIGIPKGDKLLEAQETLLAEIQRIKQHGFTETELERAKTNTLRSYEKSLAEKDKSESQTYAMEFMRSFIDQESIPGIEMENELVKLWLPEITLKEVNALSDKFVKPDNNVLLISAPEKESVTVPTKEQVIAVFNSASSKKYDAYVDEVSSTPLISKIPEPGKIILENKIPELGVTEWTLSNNVMVVFKPTDFKNDEIQMRAFSPGGHSIYGDEDYINASSASSVIDQSGIGEMNADKLTKLLSGKIVSVSPRISELSEGFSGSASPQDFETMFQLIYLYFNEARVDEEALKAMKNQYKLMLDNAKNSPESVFRDSISYVSSGYHFRSRPYEESMIEQMNGDKIFDLYFDRFADASDFTFFFVGNIETEQLKKFATTYLANLPAAGRVETWKDINKNYPKGKVERTVYKGIEQKSAVRLIFSGDFEWNEKNNFDLEAMASVLRIKLRETLREDKGGVYGVGAFARATKFPKQEYQVQVMFGCNPERVDELIEAVLAEMSDMQNNLPSDSNMTKVKETEKRSLEVDIKDNSYWMNQLYYSYFYGEDPKDMLKEKEMIDALTPKDVQEAAKKYLRTDNYMKFILYPENKK